MKRIFLPLILIIPLFIFLFVALLWGQVLQSNISENKGEVASIKNLAHSKPFPAEEFPLFAS
jgi:hypothetical protein